MVTVLPWKDTELGLQAYWVFVLETVAHASAFYRLICVCLSSSRKSPGLPSPAALTLR